MNLRDQLQTIYDTRGLLTPEIVVQEARDPDHELHHRFEWDDAVAGEAYRRGQAHELIRSVRVVYRQADHRSDARSVRAFHAVRTEQGHVYEPAEKVVADPFLTRLVLADMEREWQAMRRRYEHMAEFRDMIRRDMGGEEEAS